MELECHSMGKEEHRKADIIRLRSSLIKLAIGSADYRAQPTHHHRDHSGGVPDYVAAGAKLIVPEISRGYWANIPDVEIITFK